MQNDAADVPIKRPRRIPNPVGPSVTASRRLRGLDMVNVPGIVLSVRTPALLPLPRDRYASGLALVGVSGCVFAATMGVSAAAGFGVQLVGALIGLMVIGVAVALYRRDPILALIWLWVFEIANTPLSAVVGYSSSKGEAVRQGDEILVLLFVLLTVSRLLRTNVRIPPLRYLAVGLGVACFGLLGGVIHQAPLTVTVLGAWLGLKFWIMVGITLALPWKTSDMARIYSIFTKLGLFVAALGLIDYVTHGAVSRTLHTSVSYSAGPGYRSNAVQSILATPGEYSLFMSLLFALTLSRLTASRSKDDLVLVLLFAVSAILSLRLKGVLSLGIVVLIITFVQFAHDPRSAAVILAIGAVLGATVYGVERSVITKQVSTYSSAESTPRAKLYSTSERIALRNFPFGVGFGRFASYPSRIYYSPVYREYGLNDVWGLSPKYPKFIDDTSWPSVLGETGYGGFAIYVAGLVILIGAIIKRLRVTVGTAKWVPLAALSALGVLLVDSLGDPTLFDWFATTAFAMILGPAMVWTSRSTSPLRKSEWSQI